MTNTSKVESPLLIKSWFVITLFSLSVVFLGASYFDSVNAKNIKANNTAKTAREGSDVDKKKKSDSEWKAILSDEQFKVTRKKGTERAFTGKYWNNHEEGNYNCVCCGNPLFGSQTKFESGTGWPSFYKPIDKESVEEHQDKSLFMTRTEVVCKKCDAHLGHVFPDGPKPTNLRYCINSAALDFEKNKEEKDK